MRLPTNTIWPTTWLTVWFLLSAPPLAAQPLDSEWSAFTSMSELTDLLVDGFDVWAATSGGVLHYNRLLRRYERFSRLDGLAGNQLRAIAADSFGDLWFGTAGQGLSRFHRDTGIFDPPFLEFRDLTILSLLADGNRLYVGTSEGISVFLIDRQEVKENYRRLGNLAKDTEATALAINDGVLFAGTPDGVAWAPLDQANLQDPDSWRSQPNTGPIADLVTAGGLVHAGSMIGIFTYDPQVDKFYYDFSSRGVTAMGNLGGVGVAATFAGDFVTRRNRGDWQRIGAPIINDVTAMSRNSQDHLWLGTDQGLRVVGVNAPTPPPSGEPGSSRFYEIALVGDELWAASAPDDQQRTLSAGAYRLVDDTWTVFDRSTGMPTNDLVALETDRSGRLWIGSWGGGVSMLEPNDTWVNINRDRSVLRGVNLGSAFVVVSDIQRDRLGNMWLLNVLAGVAVLDDFPATQELLIDQVELGLDPTVDFYRMAIGPDDLKWIASRTDGLILLDDGGTPFTEGDDRFVVVDDEVEPRLTSTRLLGVYVDDTGKVWMATDFGLNVLTPDYDRSTGELRRMAWRTYTTFDGLLSSEINAMEGDDSGNIWVGTEGGLTRIGADGEIDFTMTQSNSGLIDNRVKGLTFDSRLGEMWIGTFDGLSRLRVGASEETDGPEGFSVYPNPFVTAGRDELTFTGLPLSAALRIYTIAGEPVAALQVDPGRASITWNGLNDSGFLVASGIYYYIAEGETGERSRGRFAVVNGAR
jgi:ligand-binding sensor domain-containing protein